MYDLMHACICFIRTYVYIYMCGLPLKQDLSMFLMIYNFLSASWILDVQVSRMAKVAKLIEAVKDVFDHSANDDEVISWYISYSVHEFWFIISWKFKFLRINMCRSHVWGHFCLCYNGKKLLDYKAYIRVIGIKDGDQVPINWSNCT